MFFKIGVLNPLSINPTKQSNTLKQFVGKLPTNCLGVFDDFVKLALKGLRILQYSQETPVLASLLATSLEKRLQHKVS